MRLSKLITNGIDLFYITPINRFVPIQTFRYAVCGGGNAALSLLIYFLVYHFVLCKQILYIGPIAISPYIASFLIPLPITFFTGFWLQRHIAFRNAPLRGRTQRLRYLFSVAGSVLLNYLLMKCFVEVCMIYPTPSQALTTLFVTGYSYIMQKYFTFRNCCE